MRSLIGASAPLFVVLLIIALPPLNPDADARCVPFDPGYVTGNGGWVMIVPDGSGPSLAYEGAAITVQMWRCPGEPFGLEGYPAQDMWLDVEGLGTLAFCAPGAIADGPTDQNGIATFSRALAGGGSWEGEITVRFGGVTIPGSGYLPPHSASFRIVSPDLNGDLVVDLYDFAAFGLDYGSNERRSNFDFVGPVDLYDFVIFGRAFGASCP